MPGGPVYLRCFGSCFKRLCCSCGAREVRNARRANGLFIFVDRILVRLDLVWGFFLGNVSRVWCGRPWPHFREARVQSSAGRNASLLKKSNLFSGLLALSLEETLEIGKKTPNPKSCGSLHSGFPACLPSLAFRTAEWSCPHFN